MSIDPAIPRVALVTGAARRIGRAIALALSDAGFSVAVHANTSIEAAEQTAHEVTQRGVAAIVLQADLTDEVPQLIRVGEKPARTQLEKKPVDRARAPRFRRAGCRSS